VAVQGALGEIDAAEAAIGLGGRFPRCLFAAFSNIAPGVDFERFQRWYYDVHRPDSLELDLFTRSLRFEAASPSKVRWLTLWEAAYPDLDTALAKIRPAALSLHQQGRIWPVQEVPFSQFVFLEGVEAAGIPAAGTAPPTLTTVMNDWRAPLAGVDHASWRAAALPAPAALAAAYPLCAGYAAPPDDAPTARRSLWLGASARHPRELEALWAARTERALPPLGTPTPIFPRPPGAASEPAPRAPASAPDAAWVVHWRPVPVPGSSPLRY
jgi:hypothetical protein